jgi:Fe2+ transport system protein A
MAKSEPVTQDWTLGSIPRGELVDVLELRAEHPEELLVHGIRPGVQVVVDSDAPFGGPRIVRLGSSRVAIDRRLAATVRVAPAGDRR